ncbi:activator of HSP90 ATPase [Vulcanimicrobium alpinum]|uniref:Activator of HSP90 ATPase n=1 Tax=Vulcanimicrobium alpinum TaxID=3016050 RepID=A0AAN2CBE9_UNVUL|nr:SRPBCC domain-containing protein [Vulcanimicrobium alpinum]BDE08171.1 activator of HSP90 ATPase [Vulcanimicrobium alpinum]
MITQQPAIVQEVAMEATPAAIFAALTDPAQLVQWWGGDKYKVDRMDVDLRAGGAWRTEGTGGDGHAFAAFGVYRVIEPPHTLEYTWNYDWSDGDAVQTLVRFDISERGSGSLVRVTHTGFVDAEERSDHDQGWTLVLGWLHDYTARNRTA